MSHIRLPSITKDYLSELDGLKCIFSNILPLRKSNNFKEVSGRASIIERIGFTVSLNFLMRELKRSKPDVVLAETSEIGWMTTVAAIQPSTFRIIDIHGLAFAEAKGSKHKWWEQTMKLEKEVFRNCDHLIVVSKRMKEYLSQEFKIPKNKMTVAPNGSDPRQTVAKYEDPLRVIYAGVFSYWEKVDDFLDIAKQADQKIFKFYLAGTGPMKNHLLKRIREEKIPINYLGYVPRQKIHDLLARMQIGIAPSTRDLARQVASPIKIFDYMASGLPVITPRIGDWGDMVQKENCGITLTSDTVENYVKALNTLAQENIWNVKSGNAVKSIEEKYNWTKALEPITNLLLEHEKEKLKISP